MRRPILIAHRGGLEHAAENSLEAFAAAIAGGVDGFELDLQLARGGQLVVRHDVLPPDADPSAWATSSPWPPNGARTSASSSI